MRKETPKYQAKTPFRVDSAYFDHLEDEVLKNKEKYLPMGIEQPFVAPQGYFCSLEKQILNEVVDGKTKQTFRSVWKRQKSILLAASVVLVSLFGLFYTLNMKQNQNGLSNLDSEILVAYLESQNLELNQIAIAYNPKELPFVAAGESGLSELSDKELEMLIDY